MGKLLKFERKVPKSKEDSDHKERLKKIKKSLEKVNYLFDELKNKNKPVKARKLTYKGVVYEVLVEPKYDELGRTWICPIFGSFEEQDNRTFWIYENDTKEGDDNG